jgi:predicted CoA-binding protein
MSDWRDNLVSDQASIGRIVRECRRIAVLGIKTEAAAGEPAFYVPEYMVRAGYDIVPVPVYYPEATAILDRPVYRRLADVPPPVDMVNMFRRPKDIPTHLDDILAARPRVAWFQLGIRHDEAAEALARNGILVVQDRCLLVEHRRLG